MAGILEIDVAGARARHSVICRKMKSKTDSVVKAVGHTEIACGQSEKYSCTL